MRLQDLCTNCMLGTTQKGICPRCGKRADWDKDRAFFALPAGHVLGNQYYLGRVLGSGGFGITYLAWDMKQNRRVAIKELYPKDSVSRSRTTQSVQIIENQEEYFYHIKQRFLEEAKSLYLFSEQPDIINVYRLITQNQTAYYAMEFLDGMDLKTYLNKNGRMEWAQLSGYVKVLLRALTALHDEKMIHRDISPDNIFLLRAGGVKLIDFGSLRTYNNPNGLTTLLKHNFAPIEQYQTHGNQGPWTDIYALSVTMYYALSGVLPPKAQDRMFLDKTVSLKQYCPNLPDYVVEAIRKGMAPRPEQRFRDAREYKRALFSEGDLESEGKRQICCLEGRLKGKALYIRKGETLQIGRENGCKIQYPPKTPGISRLQCTITMNLQGEVYVRDENSSYGTYINQIRLQGGKWYPCRVGTILCFGVEKYQIM